MIRANQQEHMKLLQLPQRPKKQRKIGITSISDHGIPINLLQDYLNSYSCFIDIVKLGIGSALIEPQLKEKISIYKKNNVEVYFGGTLFEKYYLHNKILEYKNLLSECHVSSLEISSGIIDIPLKERISLVEQFRTDDFNVYAEVGKKDSTYDAAPSLWINEIKNFIEAGCCKVITEGRDFGTAGIYESQGSVRRGLIDEIVNKIDHKFIIFEAPTEKNQMYFINLLGSNVNLGNIEITKILILECQRLKLRYETF
ncbi:phosphosulfolactate synthase [Candidatus Halobeggiatoa sp. HSG11]|nr:phosphosulfolactate synthase [Candidatus Halobeggiatoa sp. HSG11]